MGPCAAASDSLLPLYLQKAFAARQARPLPISPSLPPQFLAVLADVTANVPATDDGGQQTALDAGVVRQLRRPARSRPGSRPGRLGVPARSGRLKPCPRWAQPGS
jgi:hypothetical protein